MAPTPSTSPAAQGPDPPPAEARPVEVPDDPFPKLAHVLEQAARRCDTAGRSARSIDLNQDGNPDVWKYFNGLVLACKKSDLDFDGKVDMTTGYSDSGSALFHQHDLDSDGRLDAHRALRPTGKTLFAARDTDGDERFDTVERWNEAGSLDQVARDRNGDQRADLWEFHTSGSVVEMLADDEFDGSFVRREVAP